MFDRQVDPKLSLSLTVLIPELTEKQGPCSDQMDLLITRGQFMCRLISEVDYHSIIGLKLLYANEESRDLSTTLLKDNLGAESVILK